MNHHEAVEMIRGMGMRGEQALAALPQSTELVFGVFQAADSITVAYATKFGNEAVAHMRTITLQSVNGRWQLVSNVTLPMAKPITSRTGSNLEGLPALRPGVRVTDWEDPHLLAGSAVPPSMSPAAEEDRALTRAEVAHRAHFAQVAARKQREAAERALRIARRRALLRRTPGGRHTLRKEVGK
jgi:hypothetical protein